MNIQCQLKLNSFTNNYYSCNLFKAENDLTIDFGDAKLSFKSYLIFKYGYPNEEIYMHYDYYTQGSMHKYCLYEILNSSWVKELNEMNKVHQRHTNELFKSDRHFIILFQDEVFECIANGFSIEKS